MSLASVDSIGACLTKLASSSHPSVINATSGHVLSYRTLYDKASRVATALSLQSPSSYSGHDKIIITSCRDGVDSVIAAYGIWLAGGVMVPIDLLLNPTARVRQLVADCDAASFIVSDESERDLILDLFDGRMCVNTIQALLNTDTSCGEACSCDNEKDSVRDYPNAAYVVYTSGTTGEPKGVVTTHSNVIAYAKCKADVESICSQSRVLLGNHFSFDIWHGDLISALVQGAAVVVSTRSLLQAELTSIIAHSETTHCCMTPSMWSLSSSSSSSPSSFSLPSHPSDVPSLKVLSLGGEKMTQQVIDLWGADDVSTSLFNVYGATETTVFQTYALMKKGDSPSKIGISYDFATIHLDLSGAGEGEVLISGPCVSPIGYLKDHVLTAKKFFVSETHGLTFRTGDYGCFFDDGDCDDTCGDIDKCLCSSDDGVHVLGTGNNHSGAWYLSGHGSERGRDDDLIKIRGHRVTLGEVSTHLRACCAITDALCIYDPESHRIVSYLKLHKHKWGAGSGTREVEKHVDDIIVVVKATVTARAPAQCMPSVFIPVSPENWPLTISGKTDKSALIASHHTKQWKSTFAPPSSGVESVVTRAFECALGLGPDTVGRNDSFDALGGSSLNILAVCRLLEKSTEISHDDVQQAAEQQRVQQPTIGLQEGEASSLLKLDRNNDDGDACLFGVVTGVFAPCELLKRPIVSDYAAFLTAQGVQFIGRGGFGSTDDGGNNYEDHEEEDCRYDGERKRDSGGEGDINSVTRAFISACGRGDVMLVQAFLNIDSSMRMTGMTECEPLHIAAASLEPTAIDVVKCLLQHGNVDVNRANARGTTVSHIAAARGDAAMLTKFLHAGATPGTKDSDRCTILHYAVRSGDIDTVHLAAAAVSQLQTRKGGLEQWDRWKRTAASWAVHLGHVEVLSVLELYGARLTGVEDTIRQTSARVHGEWSERTVVQRALRPVRKQGASSEVLTALIRTMSEYASGQVDEETGSQATSALRELVCANSDNRDAARHLGAIPILVKLVEEYADVSAIGTLRNLPYRNATNAMACGDAGAIETIARVMKAHSTLPNDGNNPNTHNESERNVRVQYACAAALYGLRYKCAANVKRIDAIDGLADAVGALFRTEEDTED